MPKLYKSHPYHGGHVVELPSGNAIWNVKPFWAHES